MAPRMPGKDIVVTLSGRANAHAVVVLAGDSFGPWGGHVGWWH